MLSYEYVTCEKCGKEYGVDKYRKTDRVCPYIACRPPVTHGFWGGRRLIPQQITAGQRSAVAIHPVTGDEVYCFGDDPAKPLPEEYAKQGYEKVEFYHFRELEKYCRERGMVNDIEGDWHHEDGYFEEQLDKRRKAEKEQRERYMEERDKMARAHPELRKLGH